MADRLGNAPQWVSAACSVALSGIAVWGVFFSPASQALVAYLQSELAIRNSRIISLESQEQQLQKSIVEKQRQLESLTQSIKEANAAITKNEFFLVRERIVSQVVSRFNVSLPMALNEELYSPKGTRARSEEVWTGSVVAIRAGAQRLPERDQPLAQEVISKFLQQCDRLSKVKIAIPALKVDLNTLVGGDRDKIPEARRIDAIISQWFKAQDEVMDCFKATTP